MMLSRRLHLLCRSILVPALLAFLLLWPTSSVGSSKYTHIYDPELQYAATRYLPQYEWFWLKAQCYQESRLNPRAVSSAGAKGLCQFMPATWRDVSGLLRLRASVFNPKANALAAGWYMRLMLSKWTSRRSYMDQLRLAQASYNAGLGNLLKFQRACQGALRWRDIEPCISFAETKDYVIRIDRHYRVIRQQAKETGELND